jgi:hypothetical protein
MGRRRLAIPRKEETGHQAERTDYRYRLSWSIHDAMTSVSPRTCNAAS